MKKTLISLLFFLSFFISLSSAISSAIAEEISGTIQQVQGSRVELILTDGSTQWVSLSEQADDSWIGYTLTGNGEPIGDTLLIEDYSIQ